jgi:hypothetical protein
MGQEHHGDAALGTACQHVGHRHELEPGQPVREHTPGQQENHLAERPGSEDEPEIGRRSPALPQHREGQRDRRDGGSQQRDRLRQQQPPVRGRPQDPKVTQNPGPPAPGGQPAAQAGACGQSSAQGLPARCRCSRSSVEPMPGAPCR